MHLMHSDPWKSESQETVGNLTYHGREIQILAPIREMARNSRGTAIKAGMGIGSN